MTTKPPLVRHVLTASVGAMALALLVIGVVMADAHDPVPIAPDAAPQAAGAQVATFALG